MAILQGFAKHRRRGGIEREGCTKRQRSDRVIWAALCLTIYRGEGGGCAPSRVPTPRGAAALDGMEGGGQEGGRGARPRVGLRPICA